MRYDLVIIGAGTAGLCAGITAARAGKNVIIVEQLAQAGKKLLLTGGGRCNLTNAALEKPLDFSAYYAEKNFARAILNAFDLRALEHFFRGLGVEIYAPDGLQYYPRDERATTIVKALLRELKKLNVEIIYSCKIGGLKIENDFFVLSSFEQREFSAKKCLVAIGGKTVGEELNWQWLKNTGHKIIAPLPALSPLIIANHHAPLAGVSVKNIALCLSVKPKKVYYGDLLFTHQGISGPAVLDISGDVAQIVSAQKMATLLINWLPTIKNWQTQFNSWRAQSGKKTIEKLLSEFLPARLSQTLISEQPLSTTKPIAEFTKNEIATCQKLLTAYPMNCRQLVDLSSAMVLRGGVDTSEINPKTLASKLHKNLFFAGEIINIDGRCGGFNLHWACASGVNVGGQ